jgi:hypothetical protein
VWHIEKSILTNCRRHFSNDDDWNDFLAAWNSVARSGEEADFDSTWGQLQSAYRANHKPAVTYLESTWIPYKERFATPWTRHFFHLGTTTTSRVESAHRSIKSYVKVSTHHLRDVQQKTGSP